jgi:membrane-bound lytic murein transglycosylase B
MNSVSRSARISKNALLVLLIVGTAGLVPRALADTPTSVTENRGETVRAFDLQREEISRFIDELATEHNFDRDDLRRLLAEGRYQPKIIDAMTRPAEKVLAWWEYRARLVSAQRVQMGREFWQEHRELLAQTEARSGVPGHYIAAIIGVETNFGRNKGSWRVLDALMTLGFDYPPRGRFFRQELAQFLLLSREEGLDPLATRGSYAGAMGAPQFMPSSYRRFAVNHDMSKASGDRDLFNDWPDVMASIANYFLEHGWQPGEPVLADAEAPAGVMASLDRRSLRLDSTLAQLIERGVAIESLSARNLSPDTPAMLLPAELEDAEQVRVGFKNFQVITRYNRSILYAMAVHDLAMAIREGNE